MPIPESGKIAIVGANSPRGRELRELFEQRGLAGARVRLLDEDIAVGTLTRSGDEAAIIAAVDETSFTETSVVFFAGRAEMARRHAAQARQAGAQVIDLSEDPGLDRATPRIPALEPLVGRAQESEPGLLRSPSAAGIVAASLAASLARFQPARLALVFLRPVSERGQEGIDELEHQTVRLLSFQPIEEGVFGAQVAFNLMDAYGGDGELSLDAARAAVVRDAGRVLAGRAAMPAVRMLHAPVFFSYAFTGYAELGAPVETAEIESALGAAGLCVEPASGPRPTGMSAIGRAEATLGPVARDGSHETGYWLWGAADNARMVAANAVAIAETLG